MIFWNKPQTPTERLAFLERLLANAGRRYVDDVMAAEQRFRDTAFPLYEEINAIKREAMLTLEK